MAEAVTKKRLPIRRGRFVVPEDPNKQPYLIAGKCKHCGRVFCPPRHLCLNCGKEMMEIIPLSGKGKVYSYSEIHQQLPGALVKTPYVIVIVSMPEGCQISGVMTEKFEDISVGADIEVYWEKMLEDKDGNELIADKYRLVKKGKK
ncbi:MAG: Zn-ribbon domain-containing OB-fold protein [Dehalococcoidales bacterium]|nr:Zn-ribbon domain-containing OB-fold protein [Dehalococcoidales bacterium]